MNINGLQTGETLRGIDFRPANGSLYALGSSSRGYLIDISNGNALSGAGGAFTLSGTRFGFDFNPTVDRVRVVSDADQNLRLNPNDGTVSATDTNLNYAPGDVNGGMNPKNPNVVGSAYTNSFVGATATTLYGIDSSLDILVTQNPPNSGTLNTVGALGVSASDNVGFDISAGTGMAFASLSTGGAVSLYRINLASGNASLIGPIGNASTLGTATVTGIAVLSQTPTRIINFSARARVGLNENVLIGGFITRGGRPTVMLGRALGPSLRADGVSAPLTDPMIEIWNANGTLVAKNDDYRSSPQAAEIMATGLAPTDDREAAVFGTLAPGEYWCSSEARATRLAWPW